MEDIRNQKKVLLKRIDEKHRVLDAPRKVLGDIKNINPNWREMAEQELDRMVEKLGLLADLGLAKVKQVKPLAKVINYLRNGPQ